MAVRILNDASTKETDAEFRVDLPTDLVAELQKCKDDTAVAQVGCEWGVQQCKELIAHGVPSLHFYTLNAFNSVYNIAKAVY